MSYSIGKVANITGIAISTLRYYDREGLFPNMERRGGGIRVFSDNEIEVIKIIECLKISGMSIKDIKQFLDWCQESDASLQKRRGVYSYAAYSYSPRSFLRVSRYSSGNSSSVILRGISVVPAFFAVS